MVPWTSVDEVRYIQRRVRWRHTVMLELLTLSLFVGVCAIAATVHGPVAPIAFVAFLAWCAITVRLAQRVWGPSDDAYDWPGQRRRRAERAAFRNTRSWRNVGVTHG